MKKSIIFLTLPLLALFACRKEETPEIGVNDVKSFIVGEWKLVEKKANDGPWETYTDTDIIYHFLNDSMVNMKFGQPYTANSCTNGGYQIKESSWFSPVYIYTTFDNTCLYDNWNTLYVERISEQTLELSYINDFCGTEPRGDLTILRQRYVKQ